MPKKIRVAALQTKNRTLSYKLSVQDALAQVRTNLNVLVTLADQAGERGCKLISFPEDTLGTLEWESGNWDQTPDFLSQAEAQMTTRLGDVANKHGMNIVCCNDCQEGDHIFNTSILIGPQGNEIGRYRKVQPTLSESRRKRGLSFPVYQAPHVGDVGMCICYDMMFPETTRALALNGADIVCHPTLGGAAMADADVSRAAFRTRAAENFIYIVVAFRGGGSMILGPKGEILADGGNQPDAIVSADIDLQCGREAGDALGERISDFRARLFRERNPEAYHILTHPHPPILDKLKDVSVPTIEQAATLMSEGLTTGADAFYEADRWLAEGKKQQAREQYQSLSDHFGTTWIGRASRQRIEKIESETN
jgi:predicted amidohydrolase